jgi:hypothetical protein
MGDLLLAMVAPGCAAARLSPWNRERVWSLDAGSSSTQHRPKAAAPALDRVARADDCPHHWGMDWTTPSYEELKMDAEIGSYQQDDEPPPFVEQLEDAE